MPTKTNILNHFILVLNLGCAFKQLAKLPDKTETIDKLKALLQEADLVKFAKSKPLAIEIEEDRKDAKLVIDNLKPKPIIEDDELE